MKQGRASHSNMAGTKTDPAPQAVNVAAVSEIGIHQYRTKEISLYEGRGYEAPTAKATSHKSGSQGEH